MLDTIEEAIDAIRNGEIVLVVDDDDRENEGDMICASACITPDIVNFMVTHGRGLICVSLPEERCRALDLPLMVANNTAVHSTAFTVSVDLIGKDCGTGISTSDRAKTIQALIDPKTRPYQLGRPGHVFPLIAEKNGVLSRPGHTEAAMDLARLAGFAPSGVLIEVLNEDGSMARLPQLRQLADRFKLKLVSIKELIGYLQVYDDKKSDNVHQI